MSRRTYDFMVSLRFAVEAHGTFCVQDTATQPAIDAAGAVARAKLPELPDGLKWVCTGVDSERMGPARPDAPVVEEVHWHVDG